MMGKTAVVIIHGMGEQIPMETLTSFVDAVWTEDDSLVSRDKPDPDTGGARTRNASWSKPDRRNRSFELRVVTTETGANQKRIDFYEYYWAHRILDTTWVQLRAWIFELMLRNPVRDVPRGVLPVWILMWLIAIGGLVALVLTLRPTTSGVQGSWLSAIAVAAVTALLGWLIGFMVSYFGDVARYVKAKPANVARRQEIRENGVQLLETLMGVSPEGGPLHKARSEYDRIVVVAHSLGTIVAYDILTHAFARVNNLLAETLPNPFPQDARTAIEDMVRSGGENWSVEAFHAAQAAARNELNKVGNPWIVSDFVTLGSPLAHAEFLMARDRRRLDEAKRQRVFPTCPPTMEHDRKTGQRHFTYRSLPLRDIGVDHDPAAPRAPHHAALFAYTRWSNIHSPHRAILWGDIISGPLGGVFGLGGEGGHRSGIRDIQVMPSPDAPGDKRPFFSHTKYWSGAGPHIRALREVLRLRER